MLKYYTFIDYYSSKPSFRKEAVYNDCPICRIPVMAPVRMPFTEPDPKELIYISPSYIEYERRDIWKRGHPEHRVYFNRAIPEPLVKFIVEQYF